MHQGKLRRAQGCLLGQLAGDALGSQVEFMLKEHVYEDYPNGVRDLTNGGTWETIAGQPTDDSEMALSLARMLIEEERYNSKCAFKSYVSWLNSNPFDCGSTIRRGLQGQPDHESQANGAMMRISPLGIFGANHDVDLVDRWARQDAALTHPHLVCQEANALFAMAIACAISTGCGVSDLYVQVKTWADDMNAEKTLIDCIRKAATEPPQDYYHSQGWVLIAFQNALWYLTHVSNPEEAIVNTVSCGGDTDTNAAICGALLGAVYGLDYIPSRWIYCIVNCRPRQGKKYVIRPRPEYYWPADALELAEKLVR